MTDHPDTDGALLVGLLILAVLCIILAVVDRMTRPK